MQDGIHNARITKTFLGLEDHGMFVFNITVDYGGSQQGYQRVWWPSDLGPKINKIFQAAGVCSWEELPGKYIKVDVRDGLIYSIGHILKDQWDV